MSLGYPGQGRKGTQRNRLGDNKLPSAASLAAPDGHYDDDGGLRQARRTDCELQGLSLNPVLRGG
jgi:hypothetical protein